MKHKLLICITIALCSVYQTNAQSRQDPNNAVQLSHDFDQHQGRLNFHSDNSDFCDYYLYITFVNSEGFEGMPTGTSVTVGPGQRQIMTYRVRKDATRYSYNYRYVMYRGDYRKKTDIDFVYSLPVAAKEAVTAWITENPEGYQLSFDLSSDTVYACRSGVMCDDNLKDNTAKGHKQFNDNRNLSQITVYHSDGSFGEYIFKGKSLVYPGEKVKMGAPVAVIDRTVKLRFAVYFLDKNKLKENIGNKHTHFRPFFQTVNEGKTRLENDRTYLCEYTDEMLGQDTGKRAKKTAASIPEQQAYQIQDPEKHLSKKEKQTVERAVNYQTAFYNRIFPDKKVDFSDIKFTVIPNQIEFTLYVNKSGGIVPRNSPGIYIPASHELVVCTSKTYRGSFISILCHEMSHAFLHVYSGNQNIPAWLNEGLAVYLQEMTYDKNIITQRVNRRYVARVKTLIELNDLNLSDFVTWDYRKFSTESFSQEGNGYAIGYCMALFMMQQDENNAITIFRNLIGEHSSRAVFDNCYSGGFAQFEKDFMEYCEKL